MRREGRRSGGVSTRNNTHNRQRRTHSRDLGRHRTLPALTQSRRRTSADKTKRADVTPNDVNEYSPSSASAFPSFVFKLAPARNDATSFSILPEPSTRWILSGFTAASGATLAAKPPCSMQLHTPHATSTPTTGGPLRRHLRPRDRLCGFISKCARPNPIIFPERLRRQDSST